MLKEPHKKRIKHAEYSYELEELLKVGAPTEPEDYAQFWQAIYDKAILVKSCPELKDTGKDVGNWRVFDLSYTSTNGVQIGGWMLLPKSGEILSACVVGHGYGGRNTPDFDLPLKNTAILFYCARGISRSPYGTISDHPYWHVLHDIQDRDKYVIRGCVEDTWLAVSALLRLFPQVKGRIGYMGTSFGGGVGAMALAWDKRVKRAYFCLPSFGNQMLRLKLKTIGSAYSLQRFEKKNPGMAKHCLQWYDASIAAKYIHIPVLCACAKFDPAVVAPGQFSVYNSLASKEKKLYVLERGHIDYVNRKKEFKELNKEIEQFFSQL